MARRYIKRNLKTVITKAASQFPAVVWTSPCQSGKTSLLKALFGDHCGYDSLKPPDFQKAAIKDPRSFLELYPELMADPRRVIQPWHASYIQSYLEQDVRSLRHVGDLTKFQCFLRALAPRDVGMLCRFTGQKDTLHAAQGPMGRPADRNSGII